MILLQPHEFESLFRELSSQIPLEVFAFGGSLLEEIVSPIPSYLIMGIVGSLAFAQQLNVWQILGLTLLGALGKSLGAALYYFIGDVLEDTFRVTISRLFKVTPEAIENFGARFTGAHWKDGGVIFLLRLFPFTPVTPFSIACGMLKIKFSVYFIATFLGNFFKDVLYVLLGYYGVASISRLWQDIHWYKVEFEWILSLVILGVVATFFFQSDIWRAQRKKFIAFKKSFK